MYRYIDQQITCNEESFSELHVETMTKLKIASDVTKTFRQLNICHVQKSKSNQVHTTEADNFDENYNDNQVNK